jgi:hypothetical protein
MIHLLIAALLTPTAPTPTAPTAAASYSGPTTLYGKGTRGDATLGGTVSLSANGSAQGAFVLYLTPVNDVATACRYAKFGALQFVGNTVTFNAQAACTSVTMDGIVTHWTGTNAFSFVLGTGNELDSVDVNMSGPTGITVPGGLLDSGDFTAE